MENFFISYKTNIEHEKLNLNVQYGGKEKMYVMHDKRMKKEWKWKCKKDSFAMKKFILIFSYEQWNKSDF